MVHQPNKDETTTPPKGTQNKFVYCPLCGQNWDKDCDNFGCWECGYNYHTEKEFSQSEKELWYNAIEKIVREHCENTTEINYEELGLDIAIFFNYDTK